jgi:aspartyl-tRNA(Asn)/glutamyl-tRNA(Gln) amidotransferase subunit C
MEHLAMLARLELSPAERQTYASQLQQILGYFRQLQQVDVADVEPMAHPFEAVAPLREDRPHAPWAPERSLANAPAQRDNQIVVPKVVEDA